ncbi:MAG: DNA-directed RNA polymerase [Candidatus Aenigmarchaeota archaeon]|nr:DNA-directed RNA polymerase [Candidatus Aenigmarchaeota archaeon]
MYRIVTLEDKIRVPPTKLNMEVGKAVKESIAEQMEGLLDPRIGVILSVTEINSVGEGKITAGDPGVFYNTNFNILAYKPELQELASGEVIDNTEFGSFVRIGPMDGLIHISQLMDDYVSYDNKNSVFLGKESKRTLKEKDLVRARIIAVSFGKEENKIGLTMRQSGLGVLSWIEDEKRKAKKGK